MSEMDTETETETEAAAGVETEEQQSDAAVVIDEEVVKSIPITLNVEVGKTKLKLKDLLAVAQKGTVLELDRSVGDLLDIKVNDAVIAKGEVVAISQNKLGVRIFRDCQPNGTSKKTKVSTSVRIFRLQPLSQSPVSDLLCSFARRLRDLRL